MRTLLVVGTALIGLGVLSLAYCASPIQIVFLDSMGQKLHPLIPTMGGSAILIGSVILFAIRSKPAKNEK